MAFSIRSCLFFFLSLLLLSIQTNARSYSFSKFHRENLKDENPTLVPVQTNETNEQDNNQNPPFLPESGNGYGLYGHETTYNNNEESLNNKNYEENVNNDDSFSTPSLSQTQESYNNYGDNYPKTIESYDNNNNNNNKDMSYYDNNKKDTIYYDNNNKDTIYYDGSNGGYGMKKREREAFKGYSNNVERQGMSDTRFMSNGKYYYDLDDERNHGLYYQNQNYQNNYKPTGYNEKSRFKNPYSSKNMMNEQSEMFGEEQGDRFIP